MTQTLDLDGARTTEQGHDPINRDKTHRLGLKRLDIATRIYVEHDDAASEDPVFFAIGLFHSQHDGLSGLRTDTFVRTAERRHMPDPDRFGLRPIPTP